MPRPRKNAKTSASAEAKKAESEVKKLAEKAEKKAEEVKAEVKETAAKTSAEVKATAAKKTADVKEKAEKTAASIKKVTEVYIQYDGKELKTDELVERAKEAFVAAGNKKTAAKDIKVYVKPEENKAYFVINSDFAGDFDI